jgi:hypothetical protein
VNDSNISSTGIEVHRQPPGGLGSVGCLAIFVAIPAIGGLVSAFRSGGLATGGTVIAAYCVVAVAVYAFFNEDARVEIDGHSIRLTRRRYLFGFAGPEKLAWEIPLAKLADVREVTHYSPSKNGGWRQSKKLHLAQGIVLDPVLLGGAERTDSAYNHLIASLQRRLGGAFTREDDFGPLGAAMKRGELPPRGR